MEIRKEPGSVTRHSVAREDMILINRLAKTELTPDQVYTFAIRLCDNEIDRDWERFDEAALEELSGLFVGKSGIFDHDWSAQGQTARLYRTEVCRESGSTAAGDPCRYLKGYAYMLRSEKNRALIEEMRRSLVAVPAQRKAGIIKAFAGEPGLELKRLVQGHPECLRQLEALEEEAKMGRSYMSGLRKELVRLAGLADGALDLKLFARTAEKLDEEELVALTGVYRRRMEEKYPPSPQLRPRTQVPSAEEDGAFLV